MTMAITNADVATSDECKVVIEHSTFGAKLVAAVHLTSTVLNSVEVHVGTLHEEQVLIRHAQSNGAPAAPASDATPVYSTTTTAAAAEDAAERPWVESEDPPQVQLEAQYDYHVVFSSSAQSCEEAGFESITDADDCNAAALTLADRFNHSYALESVTSTGATQGCSVSDADDAPFQGAKVTVQIASESTGACGTNEFQCLCRTPKTMTTEAAAAAATETTAAPELVRQCTHVWCDIDGSGHVKVWHDKYEEHGQSHWCRHDNVRSQIEGRNVCTCMCHTPIVPRLDGFGHTAEAHNAWRTHEAWSKTPVSPRPGRPSWP